MKSNFKPKQGYHNPKNKTYKNKYAKKKVDTVQDKTIKQLKKDVDKLKEEPEIKYFDDVDLLNIPDTSGNLQFWPLAISQGDDYNQRVGEEILLKKVDWNISIESFPTNLAKRYRVIMFMDKQTNGNPPAIYSSVSLTSGLLDNIVIGDPFYCPHNYRTNERYKVFYDKLHIYNLQDTLGGYRKEINISKTFNTKIKYATSGGALTDLVSKNIWVVVLGAQQAATGTFSIYSRAYFTDS